MNKRKECHKCIFYNPESFQDMGATIPGCEINPDIWDGLFTGEDTQEHCKFYRNKQKLINEYREKWKNNEKNSTND